MNYYRSNMQGGGGGEFEATYTVTVNNELQKTIATEDFKESTSFNDQISIGSNVCSCYGMLMNCTGYNQDLTIPETVTNAMLMMFGCTKFGKNVYFKGKTAKTMPVTSMMYGCNNSLRKNIFFNSALNSIFNATGSVVSGITWTTMTNGFYNATYNIYCYYNYSG